MPKLKLNACKTLIKIRSNDKVRKTEKFRYHVTSLLKESTKITNKINNTESCTMPSV